MVDLRQLLDGMNSKDSITDDFVASFLQAGIPLNKLDHPSIRGLIKKYSNVCKVFHFVSNVLSSFP